MLHFSEGPLLNKFLSYEGALHDVNVRISEPIHVTSTQKESLSFYFTLYTTHSERTAPSRMIQTILLIPIEGVSLVLYIIQLRGIFLGAQCA